MSVTRRHCIWTAKSILKLFRPSGSPIIPFFPTPAPIPNSTGNLVNGGAKYGVEFFVVAIFEWNRRLSRKRYKIRATVTMELIGNHRWRINPCRFRWPWVTSDLDYKVMTFFEVDIHLKRFILWTNLRTLIGNHIQSIELHHFQWAWVASDPDFKVTTLFDIAYLRNNTK